MFLHFLPMELSIQMSFLEKNASCESWAQSIVASGNKEGPRVGNLRLKCGNWQTASVQPGWFCDKQQSFRTHCWYLFLKHIHCRRFSKQTRTNDYTLYTGISSSTVCTLAIRLISFHSWPQRHGTHATLTTFRSMHPCIPLLKHRGLWRRSWTWI